MMDYKSIVYFDYKILDNHSDIYLTLFQKKLLFNFPTNTTYYILIDSSVFETYESDYLSLFQDSYIQGLNLLDKEFEEELWFSFGKSLQGRLFIKETLTSHEHEHTDNESPLKFYESCIFFTKHLYHVLFKDSEKILKNYYLRCSFKTFLIDVNKDDWKNLDKNSQIQIQFDLCSRFFHCSFEKFIYRSNLPSQYLFIKNNKINYLITNSSHLQLNNINLKLFENHNLSNDCSWKFEEVKIKFDKKLLKYRESYYKDGNDSFLSTSNYSNNELINTYENLHKNPGLFSQTKVIKKYLNYFKSRKNLIYRLLFWFNEGYTNWWKPLTGILITILIKFSVLHFNQVLFSDKHVSLVPVFYSINLFKDVIMNEISLTPNFWKILLVPFEFLYLFSVFSLVTYIKREFGFGKIHD